MRNKGFTISEMLITISVIAITAAFVIIGVATVRANMNKLSASESAKEIYIASENRMLEYKDTGKWNEIILENEKLPGTHITNAPSDFYYWANESNLSDEEIEDYTFGEDGNMRVLSSNSKNDLEFINRYILIPNTIDNEVIDNACYYIELNIKTGAIYSVYYCLDDIGYKDICNTREKEFEIEKTVVGYYGGGILSDNLLKTIADPYIEIINGEELYLDISLEKELGTRVGIVVEGKTSKESVELNLDKNSSYYLDGVSHVITCGETSDIFSYRIILDSLTRYDGENKHFASLFPKFYPGEDIEITITIRPTNDYLAVPIERKLETNSLFYSIEDAVSISAIRHLENLDKRISNLDDRVQINSTAVLCSNISFSGQGEGIKEKEAKNYLDSDFICTYNDTEKEVFAAKTKSFYPIDLGAINKLDGNGYVIYDLAINLDGYTHVGMIGRCGSLQINSLGIIGSGKTNYLKYPTIYADNSEDLYLGAFVGKCSDARISNSYSTTKILVDDNQNDNSKNIYVGGFVGHATSYVEIKKCYGGGIVDSSGNYEDSIKVYVPKGESSTVSIGGFVGAVNSTDLAEFFVYDSYQTQSVSSCNASKSSAWIFEGGFIGSLSFDECNIDIDGASYMAAPIKSDIIAVTLQEINNYNDEDARRHIRFGGIVGGFINAYGRIYEDAPDINITASAKYINYFADYCGVPELFSNNNADYSKITKLRDKGLYYRNDYGRSVNLSELFYEDEPVENTYPISDYLNNHDYSFKDPTKLGHHYGDWQIKEYGTAIKIVPGHGVKSVDYGYLNLDGEVAIVNYGEEIDFSVFGINFLEGYKGATFTPSPNNDGSDGILIDYDNGKYCLIAGVGTCEFLCQAGEIISPSFEISGGGEFVYNYKDVLLQITNNQIYGNDTKLTYCILENEKTKEESTDSISSKCRWTKDVTILKNAYRGERNYFIYGKISDGILESNYSTPISREIILSRVRVNFHENATGSPPYETQILPQKYGYVEYGNSNIFKDETGDEAISPIAKRTSYEFLGWSIALGTEYKPVELNDIENYATWKKIRHRIYTYSSGGWFYD